MVVFFEASLHDIVEFLHARPIIVIEVDVGLGEGHVGAWLVRSREELHNKVGGWIKQHKVVLRKLEAKICDLIHWDLLVWIDESGRVCLHM